MAHGLASDKFDWDLQLSRLGKPVDRTLWDMTPQTVNAYYDPVMNQVWTLLHAPCVTVPAGKGPKGLPVGLTVVGRLHDDARALVAAHWIQGKLA